MLQNTGWPGVLRRTISINAKITSYKKEKKFFDVKIMNIGAVVLDVINFFKYYFSFHLK